MLDVLFFFFFPVLARVCAKAGQGYPARLKGDRQRRCRENDPNGGRFVVARRFSLG